MPHLGGRGRPAHFRLACVRLASDSLAFGSTSSSRFPAAPDGVMIGPLTSGSIAFAAREQMLTLALRRLHSVVLTVPSCTTRCP